jgi:hypothetical protein
MPVSPFWFGDLPYLQPGPSIAVVQNTPIQGTHAENEFFFVFHAVNLSKAGYTVIPDLIREDTFLSRTEVD